MTKKQDLTNIDLNLNLSYDSYLLNFPSFEFINFLEKEYIKNNPININIKEYLFDTKYPYIANFIKVVSLKNKFDILELLTISYITYQLKGAVQSIKTILDFLNCSYPKEEGVTITLDENGDRILDIYIDYLEVLNPYLAEYYLLALCKDLLFFTKYSLKIKKLSVVYEINGEVNKTYYTASSYYVESDKVITSEIVEYDF